MSMSEAHIRELLEYWRMSSAYCDGRHERMAWAAKRFCKQHPSYPVNTAYIALSRHLNEVAS